MWAALLLTTAVSAAPCFTVLDQTPGWKQVALPPDAPALAAPADISQFRVTEPTTVHDRSLRRYLGSYEQSMGSTSYQFDVASAGSRLQVEFVQPLRGARVDAVGTSSTTGRSWELRSDDRIAGERVDLTWNVPGIDRVTLRVHQHLRERPVVARVTVTESVTPLRDPLVSAAFKVGRSLYFLHPGGRMVELCDAPGRTLSVERGELATSELPVATPIVRR